MHYMPMELESGILYVSEEFEVAGHLCACGCGNKIITPLGNVEWFLEEENGKPSLSPFIGNWQIPCKSHYWIRKGQIEWAGEWSAEKIAKGQFTEEKRRELYYSELSKRPEKKNVLNTIYMWILKKLRVK